MRHGHDQNAILTDRQRSCEGKLKLSQPEAKHAAKVMHKRYHKQFEAYACRHCEFHHVGQRMPKPLRLTPIDNNGAYL